MTQGLQSMEALSLYLTIIAYFISMVLYWISLGTRNPFPEKLATALAIIGVAGNSVALISRTILAQRLPLSNGYEFILTFCWGIVLIFLFSQFRFKLKALGSFVMPITILLLAFIVLIMGADEKAIRAIPPVLKSQWLTFHVLTAVFSYGAFAVSCGLALMYLIKAYSTNNNGVVSHFPESDILDQMTYKVIMFGFPLLTLVIITGAIWANYAWGTYWSWDPKETWSLITWIIYAGYLHARLMLGWKGKRAAWIAVFGFAAVLFTFFGVNYLLPGLHSYA